MCKEYKTYMCSNTDCDKNKVLISEEIQSIPMCESCNELMDILDLSETVTKQHIVKCSVCDDCIRHYTKITVPITANALLNKQRKHFIGSGRVLRMFKAIFNDIFTTVDVETVI